MKGLTELVMAELVK